MKLPDLLALAGVVLISLGAALAYLPLGIVLAGLFLLVIGLGANAKDKQRSKQL